jgi:hypothetical protein
LSELNSIFSSGNNFLGIELSGTIQQDGTSRDLQDESTRTVKTKKNGFLGLFKKFINDLHILKKLDINSKKLN